MDLAWIELIKLTEQSGLQEVRVESCDAIDSMRANDREVSHPHLLWPSLFDEAHSANLGRVTWVFLLQFGDVDVIDQIDEIHVPWQQVLDQVAAPFLESLWQHSVVGIAECVIDHVPRLLKRQLLFIDQDPQKLNCGYGWMRVIELNLVELSEPRELITIMVLFVVTNDVIETGRAEKVLLLQPELLACIRRVIGVEDAGDVLSILSLLDGSEVVALVELIEVESVAGP